MSKHRVALTFFLATPILLLVLILLGIKYLRPAMNAPPVGAGAGDTGGANAIGEYLAHGTTRAPADAPAPQMIEPESLPQGFTLIVNDQAGLATPESPIFLAGSINNWNPAEPAFRLSQQSDSKWRISLPKPTVTGRMEFKFTRGSWALEELDDALNPIANRTLPLVDASKLAPGEQPKVEFTIPKWGDQREGVAAAAAADPYRAIQATGGLRRLQVHGGAGSAVGHVRDLLVWLPPGYDDPRNAGRAYPVLYLHDGQNIFEQLPGVPGEWRADETATDLIARGMMEPIIIVGVPHSGTGRNAEYLPIPAIEGIEPQGERHVEWLVHEVMPRVERTFRVQTGPRGTAVGGSSLGAVISLFAASRYPDKFGLVLAESLPLRSGNPAAWDGVLASIQAWPQRIYLGMGGAELGPEPEKAGRNREFVEAARALDARLTELGMGPDRKLLVIEPSAVHNEVAWAKRLPQALSFLFPPPFDGTK
jgi:enterochelin esterase-like enzyme